MKANVKKDTCIGCGACQVIAANVFEMDEDGIASVKDGIDVIDALDEESVLDAADGCPTSAIEIEEN